MPPSLIGQGLQVIGNLDTQDALQVDGDIEGNVRCISFVLGDKGRVIGEIVADDVDVLGHVCGSISGQRVRLNASAHVEADIHYQTLVVEDGAFFEGSAQRVEDSTATTLESQPHDMQVQVTSPQTANAAKSVV